MPDLPLIQAPLSARDGPTLILAVPAVRLDHRSAVVTTRVGNVHALTADHTPHLNELAHLRSVHIHLTTVCHSDEPPGLHSRSASTGETAGT